MYLPRPEAFKKLAKEGNLIPVYREILADAETPVTTLLKMADRPNVFLLESVEGGENWGRYSFLGTDPRIIFRIRRDEVVIEENGVISRKPHNGDPLVLLRDMLRLHKPVSLEKLPRFYGGAVGFLGYDIVRFFERLPERKTIRPEEDAAVFVVTDTLVVFDNVSHTIKIVSCATVTGGEDLQKLYDRTVQKIEETTEILNSPAVVKRAGQERDSVPFFRPEREQKDYLSMVNEAKRYIAAGDIIQVVVSQKFSKETAARPTDLYRALRYINPSPYMFFLKLGDVHLIGSSPEAMVRLEGGTAELKPIAGTRRRGSNEQEDRQLADELLQDPKERAEHIMLVDLGRNDLGRIARTGSVQITRLMAVERYSHVMHLVSHIQAQLAEGKDAYDLLRATFPAGTLTGAPKVRTMEIIEELEPSPRGVYGGAVGYIGYGGSADFCITIRTMLVCDGKVIIQAGAGIVADSDPEAEYRETMSKAEGIFQAVRLAENHLEL